VSNGRRDRGRGLRLRQLGAAVVFACAGSTAAFAQFVPEDFFATLPDPGGAARVEANTLAYDAGTDVISAQGRVIMQYAGYTLVCDSLRYAQQSGDVSCIGDVRMRSPDGTTGTADRIEVTGAMKEAFIESLTITATNGARVTARDVRYKDELQSVLTDASYSPCGDCIDDKGRRIGWQVKAATITHDAQTMTVLFEEPSLEILGVPVAWLPWLSLPDPSSPRQSGFQLPSVNFDSSYGARVTAPYLIAMGEDIDILLSPSLMSRQGFLMAAEYQQRFDYGAFTIKGSGLYQLDPGAFDGVGNRDWRGAIQTTGEFVPVENWTVGWSYSKFTDPAYLNDYDFSSDDWAVNEVYATHLTDDFFADFRLQEFQILDDFATDTDASIAQAQQAATFPNARGAGYFYLGNWGQVRANGSLLGVYRDEDSVETIGGVDYVYGYEGIKTHASGELAWLDPYITGAGVVITPYVGLRVDVTDYDNGDASYSGPGLPEPSDELLFEATPIVAMDVRMPLIALNGDASHLFEPIAQLVYRGSDTTLVGITNDDAHSFVLDDTNLFAYDRFSGSDRQETGLRANIGGRYLATLSDDRWLEVVAGQSFHLAGTNAFASADEVNTGVSSGLESDASYLVVGVRGSPADGLTLGAKLQVDTEELEIARAGVGGDYDLGGNYSLGGDYIYLPADTDIGVDEQHEVTVRASAPLADYWKGIGSLSWDVAANEWLRARGEVVYDDGYFLAGGYAQANGPTHESPDSFGVGVKFALKAPESTPAAAQ